jgi:hypothetical protein
MGLHRVRLSSFGRKAQAAMGSESNPTDVGILNMAVDSQSLFRRTSGSSASGENRSVDDVFRAILSNANRELATLLRDVRLEPRDTVLGDTRTQHVSELLMRAVRCAVKQYIRSRHDTFCDGRGSLEELMARADQAMYEGQNRFWTPLARRSIAQSQWAFC